MIAILGALFMVGTALAIFIGSTACNRVDLYAGPQYGALWAVLPTIAYAVTDNPFAMIVATWVPTMVMVYQTQHKLCRQSNGV
jgi:hypothetical protein